MYPKAYHSVWREVWYWTCCVTFAFLAIIDGHRHHWVLCVCMAFLCVWYIAMSNLVTWLRNKAWDKMLEMHG